jgi:hypothetical protein
MSRFDDIQPFDLKIGFKNSIDIYNSQLKGYDLKIGLGSREFLQVDASGYVQFNIFDFVELRWIITCIGILMSLIGIAAILITCLNRKKKIFRASGRTFLIMYKQV